MVEDFFATAQERVTSARPRIDATTRKEQRVKFTSALEAARAHLHNIQHNPLAVKRQGDIIAFWEDQIAKFDNEEWLDK